MSHRNLSQRIFERFPFRVHLPSKFSNLNAVKQLAGYHAPVSHTRPSPHSPIAHLPSKFSKLNALKQVPYYNQPTAQGTHYRNILITPCCSHRPGSFQVHSVQCTVSYLRGVELPHFHIFAYVSHTKCLNIS